MGYVAGQPGQVVLLMQQGLLQLICAAGASLAACHGQNLGDNSSLQRPCWWELCKASGCRCNAAGKGSCAGVGFCKGSASSFCHACGGRPLMCQPVGWGNSSWINTCGGGDALLAQLQVRADPVVGGKCAGEPDAPRHQRGAEKARHHRWAGGPLLLAGPPPQVRL